MQGPIPYAPDSPILTFNFPKNWIINRPVMQSTASFGQYRLPFSKVHYMQFLHRPTGIIFIAFPFWGAKMLECSPADRWHPEQVTRTNVETDNQSCGRKFTICKVYKSMPKPNCTNSLWITSVLKGTVKWPVNLVSMFLDNTPQGGADNQRLGCLLKSYDKLRYIYDTLSSH